MEENKINNAEQEESYQDNEWFSGISFEDVFDSSILGL